MSDIGFAGVTDYAMTTTATAVRTMGVTGVGSSSETVQGPSLGLNFLTGPIGGPVLDPRITFTRASNATVTNSAGVIAYAPHNLLTFSEQFDNAAWAKTTMTVTANNAVAPNGTTTSDAVVVSVAGGRVEQTTTIQSESRLVLSIYAKAGTTNWFRYRVVVGANARSAWFNTGTGTVGTVESGAGSIVSMAGSIEDAGNGWYRCILTVATTGATSTTFGFAPTDGDNTASATVGVLVNFWGAQLNVGALQPYYPTTVKNLLGFTQEFDNPAWTKSNSSITANTTTAPDGSLTADKLVENTAASVIHFASQIPAAFVAGTPYATSVYAKQADVGRFLQIVLPSGAFTSNLRATFDLSNGTVIRAGGTSAEIVSVGNGWYRCTFIATATVSASAAITFAIANTTAANIGAVTYTGDGTSGIFIWGAQLSDSASIDQYVYNPVAAPAAAAYYGPRFDYDPVTLAPKGLLIEEQRTNLLTFSDQIDNAAWTKTQGSVTANAIVAPDGTLTGDLFVPTAGVAFASTGCATVSSAKNGTYAGSIYIKEATGFTFAAVSVAAFGGNTIVAFINLATGATAIRNDGAASGAVATAVNVGNGWWRLSVSGIPKVGDATTGISLSVAPAGSLVSFVFPAANGTDGIYVWGAQLEVGSFPTSYIPTTTATATRAGDVAVMQGANFSNWYNAVEGSIFVDAQFGADDAFINAVALAPLSSATTTLLNMRRGSVSSFAFNVAIASVTQASIPLFSSVPLNAVAKMIGAYKVNDFAATANGGVPTTDTSGDLPTVDRMIIGGAWNSNLQTMANEYLNGHIRRIAYYPRRLANAELQAVTV